ncbi:mechanosensitive ion channel family protein [Nitrospira sp. Kam-Ns4a]
MRTGILCTGLCLWLLAPGAGLSGAEGPAPANPPAADAPVLFDKKELFRVYDKLGPLGPEARARAVMDRLERLAMRPFRPGDRVTIADTCGDVVEKTLLVTRVRTIKNVVITIPNSMVLGSHLVNYSASAGKPGLILHTSVTIGYDARWRKVHELLMAAARETEHIKAEPTPFVPQTALNDFYVSYEINAYTDQPNRMAEIYSELHQCIQDKFNEAGVEIMSPHDTQLRDGNRTTIPKPYLPEDDVPPAIRVAQADEAARDLCPADLSAGERGRER